MPRRAKIRPDEPGREKVLRAGLELFGERGYHATSIAEIGERAGIAKSVLYHYFASKADLYKAIIRTQTDELLARVKAAIPTEAGAPRLQAGIDAYLGFLAEHRPAWRLLVRDPPAERLLIRVNDALAQRRTEALAELLSTPSKRASDPAHIELVATAIRTFAAWWYDNPDIPQAQVAEAIIDVARAGSQRIAAPTDRQSAAA